MRLLLLSIAVVPATAAAARLERGPWVLDSRTDRATIGFELDEPAPAKVILTTRNGEERTWSSSQSKLHRVVVDGLAERTRFRFRVVVGDVRSPEGTFSTAPAPDARARFVVFGDTRTNHDDHAAVVRGVLRELPDVVVHTGDMVADGASDDDWRRYFELEKRLLRRAVLVPTMGNHEMYRAGGADRYRGYLAIGGAREGAEEDAVYRWGDTLFLLVSSNNEGFPAAQRRYFERRLASFADDPGLRHTVAVIHHGPFSSGHHGENAEMRRDGFVDFLKDARVEVVFSGHDHDYERGVADLPYVVTGGGGAPLYPTNRRESYQERFESVHHYLVVESEGEALRMWARYPDGRKLEECLLEDGAWTCGRGPVGAAPVEGAIGWLELAAAGGFIAIAVIVVGTRVIRKRRRVARV